MLMNSKVRIEATINNHHHYVHLYSSTLYSYKQDGNKKKGNYAANFKLKPYLHT